MIYQLRTLLAHIVIFVSLTISKNSDNIERS